MPRNKGSKADKGTKKREIEETLEDESSLSQDDPEGSPVQKKKVRWEGDDSEEESEVTEKVGIRDSTLLHL